MSLKRICIHWTAGTYQATDFDRQFYHYLVESDGKVLPGKFKPEANIPPLKNGMYAAHCGGGNSYCIGVAICGMADLKWVTGKGYQVQKYPLLEKQCERAWQLTAELCKKYGIPVDRDHVFTHYNFGKLHPQSDSAGKIDIAYLPYKPDMKPAEIQDYILGKVTWYLEKLK